MKYNDFFDFLEVYWSDGDKRYNVICGVSQLIDHLTILPRNECCRKINLLTFMAI